MLINIESFPISMFVGYFEEERRREQAVFVSLQILVDRTEADFCNDELETTVDYGAVIELLTHSFSTKSVKLLETLCDRIGPMILERFPKVMSVNVKVEKSRLPEIVSKSSAVTVEETYRRS